MAVAEYTLVEGMSIREWISDGGYWVNPDGCQKMIGIGNDGSIPEGTTTFTLTADVLIKKWGTEDVTMNLDLDKIIT